MAVDMNRKYGRVEFMEGGVFPDKVTWMDWVIRLANVAPAEEVEEDEEEEQDFETRKLNYLCTLCWRRQTLFQTSLSMAPMMKSICL
jgi:hypothetical protein